MRRVRGGRGIWPGRGAVEPRRAAVGQSARSRMLGLGELLSAQRSLGGLYLPRAVRAAQDQVSRFESCDAVRLVVPNPLDLTKLEIKITPDDGLWKGLTYSFGVLIPPDYPDEAPRVRCDDPILHPSISTTGGVCVNVLREGYRSDMTLQSIAYALMFLLLEPSPVSPLNQDASELMRRGVFEECVERSLNGETVAGVRYPRRR